MTTVSTILEYLKVLAPADYKEEWDNVGLLCGRGEKPVKKAVIALDPFLDTAMEAKRLGAELVIAHHPLFFSLKAVNSETPLGRTLLYYIENGIAQISMHTNLDVSLGGVNDCLAERLGLSSVIVLDVEGVDEENRPYGCGRIGTIETCSLSEFLQTVKKSLHCQGLRYADAGRPVHKVAVGGGACAGYLEKAAALGCDTFVTGDVKYNGFADAVDLGVNMIDAGHFPTEDPVCTALQRKLSQKFPDVEFLLSKDHEDVVKFF